ncbi:HD-GYP domain-containing protein [Sulfuriferula nivalis]|uniref:HD family phosphohydrolase n=1 Tax=Sulfuriferula nivalis TaxID=2675298 RepID=A0A809SHY1_9PROT|nr:HD domain-containing phosphohydrolase [Sulfuriferula nivalis]BBP01190.1 HD family phosphohydrolase [Sulfuriferula nivalis]
MDISQTQIINVSDLRIGHYVYLDLGWMQHPFPLNHFKIQSQAQINTIRTLGLAQVRYAPDYSDEKIIATPISSSDITQPIPTLEELRIKQHQSILRAQRNQLLESDRRFNDAVLIYQKITQNIDKDAGLALQNAEKLINDMITDFLSHDDIAIRLLSENNAEQNTLHSLNVTILSMLLAKTSGLSMPQIAEVGIAGLLHDIGKIMLPYRVRSFNEQMTGAEKNLYESHVLLGVNIAKKMGCNSLIQLMIAQHHERDDGSGFPARLMDMSIPIPSQIVGLINAYDNLCNPANPSLAITPHEAISIVFAKMRNQFNQDTISRFVRMMGVYPPGSTVQLTDNRYAIVISVNSARPLKPNIIVYDRNIPVDDALILDLTTHPELNIQRSIKPIELPKAVYDYLSPRKRACYFFERGQIITSTAS